jgi:hypothetical protein
MKTTHAEVDRQQSALAAMAERERLARELHDGLAQVLGYIKMQVQAACDALERDRPDEASTRLRSVLAIAQEAHGESGRPIAGSVRRGPTAQTQGRTENVVFPDAAWQYDPAGIPFLVQLT